MQLGHLDIKFIAERSIHQCSPHHLTPPEVYCSAVRQACLYVEDSGTRGGRGANDLVDYEINLEDYEVKSIRILVIESESLNQRTSEEVYGVKSIENLVKESESLNQRINEEVYGALFKSTNRLRNSLLPKDELKLAIPFLLLIAQH
ncbi:hypothetical protein SADUNF_Sadunf18G0047100 [Salix dunnii]|uniref:Uncharacterized protein n=1 Tax=Salix dunnii TaxID=1413687 RepID=A0A835J5G4_9ROSI|nr:hypothetical protein SADUNF_Sadunf18G0047100 [Salix dunnii]